MSVPVQWCSADGLVSRTLLCPAAAVSGTDPPADGVPALCQPGWRCRLLLRLDTVPPGLDMAQPAVTDWLLTGEPCWQSHRTLPRELSPRRPHQEDAAATTEALLEQTAQESVQPLLGPPHGGRERRLDVQLGEADTELDRLLELCLLTLRPGDSCHAQLLLRPDRLPDAAAAAATTATATAAAPVAAAVSESAGTDAADLSAASQHQRLLTIRCRLTLVSAAGERLLQPLSAGELLAAAERARRRGNVLSTGGRPVDAFHRYRRAMVLLLRLPETELDESQRRSAAAGRLACRANLAACQLARGRHAAARAAATRVLHEQPDHVRCLYRRGVANLALQELDRAEQDLSRVVQLQPTNAAAAQQMALLKQKRRAHDRHTAGFMSRYLDAC